MNFYWVYSLPTWLFAVLTIALTAAVGLAGLFATRKWVRRIHGDEHSHNDVVGFYLGAVCVFYGITLGLLAIATWQNFTDVETRVGQEAAAVGVLYRDVSAFPEPYRLDLQSDLRRYAREVVDVAWPLQRQGIVPESEGNVLSASRHISRDSNRKPKARKRSTRRFTPGLIAWRTSEADGCKVCEKVCQGHYGLSYWLALFSA
jgi:hypothetical protein